jgi:precorrin-3B C17-methyltransferase
MTQSKIYVVGIGPGSYEYMCPRAIQAMNDSDIIIGFKTYIDLVKDIMQHKKLISSAMKKEVERCEEVLNMVEQGNNVSLISSGDAGIYGMAGIMMEVAEAAKYDVDIEVVPGISAANAAASLLGAPLMNDFVTLSLSDLMTPWEIIRKRIEAACLGDFVISIYNPKSKTRVSQLNEAIDIMLKFKSENTPVGIVKHAMRNDAEVVITDLKNINVDIVDMFTTLIIGNSQTRIVNNRMVTRRGYKI